MTVDQFLWIYPHPIHIQTNRVTCIHGAWANHTNWPRAIKTGDLLESVEELLRMLYTGERAACEQPSTAFECSIVGPYSFVTLSSDHGDPAGVIPTKPKTLKWWTRGGLAAVAYQHCAHPSSRTAAVRR